MCCTGVLVSSASITATLTLTKCLQHCNSDPDQVPPAHSTTLASEHGLCLNHTPAAPLQHGDCDGERARAQPCHTPITLLSRVTSSGRQLLGVKEGLLLTAYGNLMR
eukprot:349715-Chlamydomonas_euryale.AAC.4